MVNDNFLAIDNLLAIIFRLGVMVIMYYLLFQQFHRAYNKSKNAGFKNTYFLGFMFLFLILFIFHIVYGLYELYSHSVSSPFNLKAQFPWYVKSNDIVGLIINNQMRPAFLIFYFLVNCVMAAQIYPLEKANNWNKNPVMKAILICGCSLWLLFVPTIGNSPFAIIPVLLGFIGIGLGFILNILILIKLYKKATGDLRTRALYGVLAFLFLAVGLVLAMEVGWGAAITEQITYRWEVVIGSIMQIIAAIFYSKGFQQKTETESLNKNSSQKVRLGFKENLKGNFTTFELLDFLVIFGILGLLFLLLSVFTYPPYNNYSIMKDTISFLGSSDADNNPDGWWFFSIALFVFGFMMFPIAFYRFKRFKLVNKPLALISLLFYIIADIGLILVALIPDNGGVSYFSDLSAGRLHNYVSILAFGGFGLAFLVDLFIFLLDNLKFHYFNAIAWVIVYIIFFIVVGMTAYTQITWSNICKSNCWPGDGIYSFPLWEWIILFMLFFILYAIILTLPNDIEKISVYNKTSSKL